LQEFRTLPIVDAMICTQGFTFHFLGTSFSSSKLTLKTHSEASMHDEEFEVSIESVDVLQDRVAQ
jgi:hypothetical protein